MLGGENYFSGFFVFTVVFIFRTFMDNVFFRILSIVKAGLIFALPLVLEGKLENFGLVPIKYHINRHLL